MIGIYRINIDKYFYFGSSKDIQNRIRQHKHHLKNNKHHNPFMQNVYDKYGTFEWEVVQICDLESRLQIEDSYIKKSDNDKFCMNVGYRKLIDVQTTESYLVQLEKLYKNIPEVSIAIERYNRNELSLGALNNIITRNPICQGQ